MATTKRHPDQVADNLFVIIGQLLEATKAASDGLKSMSQEVQLNAKAIIAASKTLELVDEKVGQLDTIVRDSTHAGNLLNVTQGHAADLATLKSGIADLKAAIAVLRTDVGQLGNATASLRSSKDTVWSVVKTVAWIVTTGVALFAAFNNGK